LGALAALAAAAAIAPAAASASSAVTTAVWTIHGHGATSSSSMNVMTVNDFRGIDNRISLFTGPTGRTVLTAPEGLGDPDGSGSACALDNAKPSESTAQEVSCAPGYIGAIVGDLNGGNDTFTADGGLTVYVGAVIDGERRPLSAGPGRDRLVGGAATDLLEGAGGPDSIVGGADRDVLVGGPGADNLGGGAGSDFLLGRGGSDKLNGGSARDLCRGGGGTDSGKSCEVAGGIP
jgi:hypothetical protein